MKSTPKTIPPGKVSPPDRQPQNDRKSRSSNPNTPQCPECGSFQVYTRRRDYKRICRRCGKVWDMPVVNRRDVKKAAVKEVKGK